MCNEGMFLILIETNCVQRILVFKVCFKTVRIQSYTGPLFCFYVWMSSIGKTLAYELDLFSHICTSQIATEIGWTACALLDAVSHPCMSLCPLCTYTVLQKKRNTFVGAKIRVKKGQGGLKGTDLNNWCNCLFKETAPANWICPSLGCLAPFWPKNLMQKKCCISFGGECTRRQEHIAENRGKG